VPTLALNPNPIRVIVPGKFWDSQLYAGTLFLFGLSGELSSLSWDELVADLPLPPGLRVAAEFALLGNHHLYEPGARLLLGDPDMRQLLFRKFHELSEKSPWEVRIKDPSVQENPMPFPHNDSEAHYQTLYVAASEGVSDVPTFNIAAKYRTIAQAAGTEGLYAAHIGSGSNLSGDAGPIRQTHISKLPCMTCEWASSSIIAAGFENGLYMAPYETVEGPKERLKKGRIERQFQAIISESDIFGNDSQKRKGFTWGAGDKIFRFEGGHVEVVQYGRDKRKRPSFSIKGDIAVDRARIGESVVSARAASFGSVVEGDDGLFVMLTTGELLSIDGEPTNWRVFPRSRNYLNHLHIVYRDRLEVWAFTHDYFVDQGAKLAGLNAASPD